MIVFLLLVVVVVLILPGRRSPLASVLVFSCIVPLICLVPFLLELLSAMAFGRRPASIRKLSAAFWNAWIQWYTYNQLQNNAPGIFQSPIRSCKTRQRLTLAAIFLTATPFIQYVPTQPYPDLYERPPLERAYRNEERRRMTFDRAETYPRQSVLVNEPGSGDAPPPRTVSGTQVKGHDPEQQETYLRRIREQSCQTADTGPEAALGLKQA